MVGLGARQRGTGGQGLAPSPGLRWRASHLPRLPEEFTAMLGADTLGGRGQGLSEGVRKPQPLRRCLCSQLLCP